MEAEVDFCTRMVAEEEKLAGDAPSPEAAEIHHQMLMLYRAQLKLLQRKLRV